MVVTGATGDYSVPYLVNGTYTIKKDVNGECQSCCRSCATRRSDLDFEEEKS